MADKVTFTMEADVAQVVRANEQVVASEKKVEQQFTQTARSAEQSNRQIEQSTRRTATTVASSVQEYGLSPLGAAPPGGGSAVRFSSAGSSTRRPRAFSLAPVAVQSVASQMVIERASGEYEFASEAQARRNLTGMELLLGRAGRGMARADERYNARIGAAATSALNAGTIAYAAGGGVFGDDDDLTSRARRRVAANVMRMPELQGKVSDQEFEVMSRTMARKMQDSQMAATKLLGVGAVVGAAMLAATMALIRDMEQSRAKLDEFASGARGATSLPSFPGGLGAFKQFSTSLSNEYGADLNRTVVPLLEQVGRQGSNLTPAGREQIARQSLRFEQLTGGPAGGFANVLDQIMDTDESVSTKQASNLVEFLRTQGGLDIGTQQQVLGTLLPTAKMAGIDTDEVAGLSAMLSGMGGPEGQLAKGGRGILGRLDVLKKGGFISGQGGLFGALTELDRLRGRQPDAFDQAMGDVGGSAGPVLDAVLKNPAAFEANVAAARAAMGGGDVLGDQFRSRMVGDPQFALATRSARANQRIANAPLDASMVRESQQVAYLELRAAHAARREAQLNSGDPVSIIEARTSQFLGMDRFDAWMKSSSAGWFTSPNDPSKAVRTNSLSGGGPVSIGSDEISGQNLSSGTITLQRAATDLARAASNFQRALPATRPANSHGPIKPN